MLSPEDIRQEAVQLRALLERHQPRYTSSRRDVSLGSNESAHVRAFWEVVGWSPLLADFVGEPEIKPGRAQAEQYMKAWRSWGGAFRLTLADLPRRFRLVEPDHGGVGFSITDESQGTVTDPPVLGVSADEGTVRPLFPSYLRCVGHALVLLAVRGWYSTTVQCRPEAGALPGSSRPLQFLSPATVKLSEELWVVPADPFAHSPGTRFVYTRYEALTEWLAARAVEVVHIPTLPGTTWPLAASLSQVDAQAPGLTPLTGLEPGTSYRVGVLEGAQVLLAGRSSGATQLATSARHAERIQELLVARGWWRPRG